MFKKAKGKSYKTVMRWAMVYENEFWALNKKKEIKIKVVMFRWMYRMVSLNRIKNGCKKKVFMNNRQSRENKRERIDMGLNIWGKK